MATPKELVAKIADLTGVPEGTVILHDRNLLNAGLRSEGQRGRGKSVVTYLDAANLLIAVAGSRNVKDSVKTVRDYADLRASAPLIFEDEGAEVKRGETFADAIAALLEAAPRSPDSFDGDDSAWIDVSLFGPTPHAVIEYKKFGADSRDRLQYDRPWKRGEPSSKAADLQFIAKFSQVTLGHVGQLVQSSDE
ncbi:hypothetical protein E5S70_33815 [Ensifer adhaerens]|uniref:hypothetical protein n=1 Tax=Ensifer canadensis TaxID=555315 RepID=UPI00149050A3|nr:hypothetical protein [Ensifer canadensis]NOV20938.1 hypothetical protein [Ensifer canadensis]